MAFSSVETYKDSSAGDCSNPDFHPFSACIACRTHLAGVERATMRTIYLLVILLALTARNAAAAPLRTSMKDRVTGTYSL